MPLNEINKQMNAVEQTSGIKIKESIEEISHQKA